jgi:hypothetical protein
MAASNQTKGKRALEIVLGFNAGVDAFLASGAAAPGSTLFTVVRQPGDYSEDVPGEADVDPLDRGQVMHDQAPILTDDQTGSGSWTTYYTHQTDPALVGMMDILNESGAAAALPSVVANSERLYCDIRVRYIHPANPADTHGKVWGQCRLTYSKSTADPTTLSVNWKSRDVHPRFNF